MTAEQESPAAAQAAGGGTVVRAGGLPLGPVPRPGLRAFLGLDRLDVILLLGLVLLAFGLRAGSPIFPDWLSHPFSGAPVQAWGLGFPYNPTGCLNGQDVPVNPDGSITHGNQPNRPHCGFVFDEVYFPVDAAKDLHQPAIDYFDPEPPLSKLLMAPPIAALGFGGWSWRLSVAVAGSLFVGLLYLIGRRLRPRDRFFALAASLFVCFDGLALVESRTGVIDMIAIFFVTLVYYAFLLHWQARTRAQWRATLYVLAVVIGLGFGAKLTALAPTLVAAGLIVGRLLEPRLLRVIPLLRRLRGRGGAEVAMWRDAKGRWGALHYGGAALVAAAVFLACYGRYLSVEHAHVYHFDSCTINLATNEGGLGYHVVTSEPVPGAAVHLGALPIPDVRQAIANVIDVTRASLEYHSEECHDHPYASRWYTWPVMAHPVLYYADYSSFRTQGGSSEIGWITDMGNPALWWLAIPALLFCVWRMTGGPAWWRVAVGALGVGSVSALVIVFNHGEAPAIMKPDHTLVPLTVRVAGGKGLYAAFASVLLFAVVAGICAVISRRFVPALIVIGFLAAWLMWTFGNKDRVLFFYHMLGALPFIALALAYTLSALRRGSVLIGDRRVSLAPVAYATMAMVLAAFIFFYPVWTGLPQTGADHAARIWLPGW